MKKHGGHLLRTDHMVQEHTGAPKPLPLFCNQSKRLLFSCAKGGYFTPFGEKLPLNDQACTHIRGEYSSYCEGKGVFSKGVVQAEGLFV